jgi:hypothetical protein
METTTNIDPRLHDAYYVVDYVVPGQIIAAGLAALALGVVMWFHFRGRRRKPN